MTHTDSNSLIPLQVCKVTEQFELAGLKTTDGPSGAPPCDTSCTVPPSNSTAEFQTPWLLLDVTPIAAPNQTESDEESDIFSSGEDNEDWGVKW